jgi:O-antigen/teichoic acid export membrane protein
MRAALGRNVIANILSALSGIAASLISLPIVLSHVGPEGYGVWTIGLAVIIYLSVADTGFGPAVQRWTALSKGAGTPGQSTRLLWTTLALYCAFGVVAMAAIFFLAPTIAAVFDFPADLLEESHTMLRIVGVVLFVTMLSAAIGNVMQGLERFSAIGLTTAAGALTYLAAVIVLLESGGGVVALAEATLIQQGVTLIGRLWAVRGLFRAVEPVLLRWSEVRELVVFSAKLQASVFSWLINSQSDKVVMGLIASTATLGQLGVASQVADAGRLVAGAALAPIVSSLAVTVAAADPERLRRHFAWTHRLWLEVIAGGTIIGLGALYPLLYAWLGDGYEEAAILSAFLVAAMGFALLGGTAAAYLRALGRPGIESRYGLIMVGLNLVFTVVLAITFGPLGVVGGTLAASALAAIWLLRRFAVEAPETVRPTARDAIRPGLLALLAGAFAAAAGLAANAALPDGVAFVAVVAATGLAFLGYLSAVTGRALTPRGMRGLMTSLRQPA